MIFLFITYCPGTRIYYQNRNQTICLTVPVNCQKVKRTPTAPSMAVDVAEIKEMNIVEICNEPSS